MRAEYGHDKHYEWVEGRLSTKCSDLGRDVANVLGYVGGGIYNAPIAHSRISWHNPLVIEVTWQTSMASWDRFDLTALVVECFRRNLRVEVSGGPRRWLRLQFTKRKQGTESTMTQIPTLADVLARIEDDRI